MNERRSQSFFGTFLYNGNGNFKTSGKANNILLFRKSILRICFGFRPYYLFKLVVFVVIAGLVISLINFLL